MTEAKRDPTDVVKEIERLAEAIEIEWASPPDFSTIKGVDALRDEALRLAERECYHGWRGRPPKDGRHIKTRCLSCHTESLFIGDGGHLTCASVPSRDSDGCKNPSVQGQMDQWEQENKRLAAEVERLQQAVTSHTAGGAVPCPLCLAKEIFHD